MIYQLLLVPAYGANDKKPLPNSKDRKYHLQIMATCWQIHNEAAKVFWKKNLWVCLHLSHGGQGSLALRDLEMDRMVSEQEPDPSRTVLQIHVFCFEPFKKISTIYIILNVYCESNLLNGFLHRVSYRFLDSCLRICFSNRSLAQPLFEEKFLKPLAVSLRRGVFPDYFGRAGRHFSPMERLRQQMDVLRIHFRLVLGAIKLLDQHNSNSAAIALAANCAKIRRTSALRAVDDLKEHAPLKSRADLLKLTIALAAYKMALKLRTSDEAQDMSRAAVSLREMSWSRRMDEFFLEKHQIQALCLYLKAIWSVNLNNPAEMAQDLCFANSLSLPSTKKYGISRIHHCWVSRSASVDDCGYMERKMKGRMMKSIELDRLDRLLGI